MSSKSFTQSPYTKATKTPSSTTKYKAPTSSSSQTPTKKRKSMTTSSRHDNEHPDTRKTPKRAKKDSDEEKRLRRFRAKPPGTYLERLGRVRTQRMFLIDRRRNDKELEEVFDIAGTTGNIYQVTINKIPDCSCPDSKKGNQCKHIIYVMVNVLKSREDLAYQLAFLTPELTEIFASAPSTPQTAGSELSNATETGGLRKPLEGDCPVCVMEFEPGEDILWCKAACGNNIHRQCFEQWVESKAGAVKCVYCRTLWKGDEVGVKRVLKGGVGSVNAGGYVNIAGQLGLSGQRDMSSYHPYWVARQYGDRYDDYYNGY
ncbi:hypothetical protein BJ878DRAFT_574999 [Calycina marina]|uniref:Uncharacterized protein n=1 Tax=Calycina marina TaxID=1763456 RepID=A0A9P7Z4U0_9HELO|nr:hypothetical protein BJ878DRAFT_574999 [Calycina marina]